MVASAFFIYSSKREKYFNLDSLGKVYKLPSRTGVSKLVSQSTREQIFLVLQVNTIFVEITLLLWVKTDY